MGWTSWFGFGDSGPSIKKVVVHYSKKEYAVTFSSDDVQDGDVKVGLLRSKLAQLFTVANSGLSLYQLEPRRKLSNDNAFLKDYNIKNGDHLYAVFKEPAPARPAAPPVKKLTPKEQLEQAEQTVESELGDRIRSFVSSPPADAKARETEFMILSELILQNIIKLDLVDVTDDPELRATRKQLINKFHTYHTDLDKAKSGEPVHSEAKEAPIPEAQPTSQDQEQAPTDDHTKDTSDQSRETSREPSETPKPKGNKKKKNKKR